MPRPFTPDERAILEFLIDDRVPNAAILRQQLATAEYAQPWYEGTMCFDIAVSPDAPRFELTAREAFPIAISSVYSRADTRSPGDYAAEISLWVEGGVMTGVEYSQAAEEEPTEWPPLDTMRLELGRD